MTSVGVALSSLGIIGLVAATPAAAATRTVTAGGCTFAISGSSTSTVVDSRNGNPGTGTICIRVDARIDRYDSSTIKTYTSGGALYTASVSASNGTNAGNLGRGKYDINAAYSAWYSA